MNKKSITILVVCLIVTVLSVSLAYYSARIIGDGKNVSVNAKELTINFDNNNEIASGIIEPGWSSANTFSVTNKSKTNFTYDIVLKNYKNTTKTNGYLVYKITSTNGYNMTEYKDMPKDGDNTYDLVIARGITIEPGSINKQSYTLEIKYLDSSEDQSIDMGSTVTGSLYIVESTTNENNPYTKGTLGYQIMEDNTNIKERTDFSKAYTDTNIGTMYKAQENNTDVYYFAGDARNNWVKLGTYNTDKTIYKGWGTYGNNYKSYNVYDSMSECTNASEFNNNCEAFTLWKKGDPIYWRIIRTDKDGGVKLLYHGNSYESENTYIAGNESYSSNCTNGIKCIDYNNSDAKIKLDKWFNENLINYSKYINPGASYCNDKSIYNSDDTRTYLSGYYRLIQIKNPTLNCNSKDVIKANIALITADEVAFAGGVVGIKNDKVWYYLNNKNNPSINHVGEWWTMTGADYSDTDNDVLDIEPARFGREGSISAHTASFKAKSFRPVITLNGENLWKSGDGSASNPYEIQETPNTLSEKIISKSMTNEDGVYNENGFRYEGSNPNNYIQMEKNDGTKELWRIIGVFPDGENGENVIRVRRHYESNNYPTSAYNNVSTSNHFPDSIMYTTTLKGYTTSNYKNTVKYKIYLGSRMYSDNTTAKMFYDTERMLNNSGSAGLSSNGVTSIVGAVSLIYPSDYGYAVLSSDCDRNVSVGSDSNGVYGYEVNTKCHTKNWLFQGSDQAQWVITSSLLGTNYAFHVSDVGYVGYLSYGLTYVTGYSPVMALSADVYVSGTGTQSDPYVMTN